MTTGERVKSVREDSGLTLVEFGARIGLKNAAVSLIENNKRALTDTVSKAIAREFAVSEDWLRTGEGEMRPATGDAMVAEIAAKLHLSEWGTQTFERFCRLDPRERAEFLRIAEQVFAPFMEEEDKTEALVRAAGEAAMEAKRAELLDEKRDADA